MSNQKPSTGLATVAALLLSVLTTLQAQAVTINVLPSSAPGFLASPNFAAYNANALTSIENGLGTTGDPTTDPTAYETKMAFSVTDMIFTNYNSWRGELAPGAPFDLERGNMVFFGVHVLGMGNQFSLGDISFNFVGSGGGSIFDFASNFTGAAFNPYRRGINYGMDGAKGGGDDTIYDHLNPGNDAVLIDEFVYVGVSFFFTSIIPAPSMPGSALMDEIDFANSIAPFTLTATYTVDGLGSGTKVATINPVPLPTSISLFAFMALCWYRLGVKKRTNNP